ncbi:conserved exported hypothetical protein [Flavobacterium sp. 9AF]|uniref:DUF7619 domain-containing protein n=1 Tax=Flavobacterium sp. 9AF TaxID=2653142 RepID=UPI0012F0B0E9|nr:T9SS type A sorting domain-containing protein [Flavobacterium sp. 9AF]VXC27902.1 conserved exported hypothetical protein [Flavobacterium sp. 9AF]
MKKILLLLLFLISSQTLLFAQCVTPTNLTVVTNNSNTITIGWTENNPSVTEWLIEIGPSGFGSIGGTQIYSQVNPLTIDGLNCDTSYEIYLRTVCSQNDMSDPVMITYNYTGTCYGIPQDLSGCADTNGLACFDLTTNDSAILGNLNPNDFTITYHASQVDAQNGINALVSPYCVSQNEIVYTRQVELANPSWFEVTSFDLIVSSYLTMPSLPALIACDANSDGIIEYDLTTAQALLATTNSLSYYTSLNNAINNLNPIASPSSYSLNATMLNSSIFVREFVTNGCDLIYPRTLVAQANCNAASNCSNANSLCGSIGVPFLNTTGMGSLGAAGCLTTTPNPTWFYLPIEQSGSINLEIKQGNNAPLYSNQDIDYILYGPFTNPATACNQYGAGNIVGCSYSAAAIEYPVIQNAQAGEYYLLMVTNFSNNSGFITINLLPTSTGVIDCSGFTFISFLDTNNNGIKDTGEINFPLGSFAYEKNNDGIVHNVTAPSGLFSIYDSNATNSYDVSYNVLSNYSSYYTVSNSYTALQPAPGMSTHYIAVVPNQNYDDLAVTLIPINQPRPGFTYFNKLVFANLGTQAIASGAIDFTKPVATTLMNTTPATITTTNGFTHNFTNLLPFEIRTIDISLQVPTIPTVNAGDILTSNATISPVVNDIVLSNNTSTIASIVINAYDPNDIMESHGPEILHSSFTSEDYLYYTIRFENTGTASAINIRVEDVLHSKLDITTLEMVSASHTYEMDRVDRHMIWQFNNIQLPVSQPNNTIGKGYITFKIKPLPGYAVGDVIPNTASIYFDFNPAIITNTFTTTFVNTLSNSNFTNESVQVYPNPVNDIIHIDCRKVAIKQVKVLDIIGHTIIDKKVATNEATIDVSNLMEGIYLLEIISVENDRMIQKIIKK